MSQSKELFALYSLRLGSRLDFDVDCRPWLSGAATIAGFEIETTGHPLTFEAPTILSGGKDVKFYAEAPLADSALGYYRIGVFVTDSEGRSDRQWFQMTVE